MSDSTLAGLTATVEAQARSIMPPYLVLRDFLDDATVNALLQYALAREADFTPTGVGRGENAVVKPDVRVSLRLRDLGRFRALLAPKLLDLAPECTARLGATPLGVPKLELELVAHNDGAFYKRHIDTQTNSDQYRIRVLSVVYYFYAEPKAFTGGALRLYAIGSKNTAFVDIEPTRNSLLIFPAWAPHEVTSVSCPSKRFGDSRFAINCWVHRGKTEAT